MSLALGGAHGSRLMACKMIDGFTPMALDREADKPIGLRQLAPAFPAANVLHCYSVLPSTRSVRTVGASAKRKTVYGRWPSSVLLHRRWSYPTTEQGPL